MHENSEMKVVAIAAVADNGVIGSGDDMLWHLPEDFRRFKRVTMGHTLVFGRRTFEQIGKLPGRRHIVCTRDPDWSAEGVDVAASVPAAVEMARAAGEDVCYIAGGAQVYAAAMELCTGLDITVVHQSPRGSARFPEISPDRWREVSRDRREGFDFVQFVPVESVDEG
ncbi:Dihydrofolate reductase [Acidipropionibacterium acidipropionici ATCC 4875]|uniref:Dihydrofolate reductase n=2 Tax=Acidipropionibacterium acidipropionici TaxID=1748 RepID=K7RYR0_ACIA4|nr:Dihydrofolate reductase [Acidipropionibacterium acidipropionici ATCC 4875]